MLPVDQRNMDVIIPYNGNCLIQSVQHITRREYILSPYGYTLDRSIDLFNWRK